MKDTCTLINRSSSRVVYNIKDPEYSARREIYPGQSMKNVKVIELEKLMQIPGGKELFLRCLMVEDEEILNHLMNGGEVKPEYWLTEEQIPSWMNKCSLDEFQDALDFAPEGVKDLIKKYAVAPTPLNDYAKRQALLDQLGFNVTKAIELTKAPEQKEEKKEEKKVVVPAGRRSAATTIVKPTKEG